MNTPLLTEVQKLVSLGFPETCPLPDNTQQCGCLISQGSPCLLITSTLTATSCSLGRVRAQAAPKLCLDAHRTPFLTRSRSGRLPLEPTLKRQQELLSTPSFRGVSCGLSLASNPLPSRDSGPSHENLPPLPQVTGSYSQWLSSPHPSLQEAGSLPPPSCFLLLHLDSR